MTSWGKRKDGKSYPKNSKNGIKSTQTTPISDIHMKENSIISMISSESICADCGQHFLNDIGLEKHKKSSGHNKLKLIYPNRNK